MATSLTEPRARATRALRLMIEDQIAHHGATFDTLATRLDGLLTPDQVHGQKDVSISVLADAADRLDTMASVWLDRATDGYTDGYPFTATEGGAS